MDDDVPPLMSEAQKELASDPELIELARRIARRNARRHPHLYEEFLSAAMYGLCLAALDAGDIRSLPAYANRVITRQIINAYREDRPRGWRQSKRHLPVQHDLAKIAEPTSETDGESFSEMIAPLSMRQRAICRCVYEQGMVFPEVAAALGLSVNQVSHGHQEALARLSGAWAKRVEASEAFRAARDATGLSRPQLAARIGKSASYIEKIETCRLVPTPAMEQVINRVFAEFKQDARQNGRRRGRY
jgi:RNA polymerase sigma factor (sigma-70 family)